MQSQDPVQHGGHTQLDTAYRSWKAIAAHFGVTVRTVQLWEVERGMQVHRMPGTKGRVYAYPDELDAWAARPLGGSETPAPAQPEVRKRRVLVWALPAALAVVAALTVVGGHMRSPPQPASLQVEGQTLTVTDSAGETLWEYKFPKPIFRSWLDRPVGLRHLRTIPLIVDIDGDGSHEVLVSYRTEPLATGTSELFCFEANGRLRWRFTPGREVSTVQQRFAPPFDIRMVATVPASPRKPPVLVVVANHRTSFPAQVVALSPQGEVLREYWHGGHILHAEAGDLENDGRTELYLASVDNATHFGEILVLDPERFGGASTEPDPGYQLKGMEPAVEVARVRLPSTLLGKQLGAVASPLDIRVRGGVISVFVAQSEATGKDASPPVVVYYFGRSLKLIRSEYSPTFRFAIEQLIRQGKARPYNVEVDLEKLKEVEIVSPWREASLKP